MKVLYTKVFERDIRDIKDLKLKTELRDIILKIKLSNTATEIPNIKKLTGYKNCYRIRLGDYRIGIYLESDTIEFARFAHRKDIYRLFP